MNTEDINGVKPQEGDVIVYPRYSDLEKSQIIRIKKKENYRNEDYIDFKLSCQYQLWDNRILFKQISTDVKDHNGYFYKYLPSYLIVGRNEINPNNLKSRKQLKEELKNDKT
jgi:hypothetical protein